MKNIYPLLLVLLLFSTTVLAQCPSGLTWQEDWREPYPGLISAMHVQIDALNRPFIYVASNELGVRIYDVSGTVPQWVTSLDTAAIGGRSMSLSQVGDWLYICTGSHFDSTAKDPPGLTIANIANPSVPVIHGEWHHPLQGNGAGIVVVKNDIAYLGGMTRGLILLDISNPDSIQHISEIKPDLNFPIPPPDSMKVNARGMEVKNGIVYLCYDAGGFRIIDCTNPLQPVERAKFWNPVTQTPFGQNLPRAYNNLLLRDTLAYIGVDYCGIEVVSIPNPDRVRLLQHWNPTNCPASNWFGGKIHVNEMVLIPQCDLLLVNGGSTELIALDVSNPTAIDSCKSYGPHGNNEATWGLAANDSVIYLAYYYFPLNIPSTSLWHGIRKLSYQTQCQVAISEPIQTIAPRCYPNPAKTAFLLENPLSIAVSFQILGLDGKEWTNGKLPPFSQISLFTEGFPTGMLLVRFESEERIWTEKLLVTR